MIRKKFKKRSKKRGPVQARKISYDGINFASGLERYMYMTDSSDIAAAPVSRIRRSGSFFYM